MPCERCVERGLPCTYIPVAVDEQYRISTSTRSRRGSLQEASSGSDTAGDTPQIITAPLPELSLHSPFDSPLPSLPGFDVFLRGSRGTHAGLGREMFWEDDIANRDLFDGRMVGVREDYKIVKTEPPLNALGLSGWDEWM
ncbi:hypothetical protein MIND_00390600 [Mycena indigotica]|uniref:Zn(2)-C6 fungal-type domain-containing protein n=1 Tax=Mycena indigotica TaxID=2126181 RepID=A0A8H6T3G5_9AGAR|nr:uncharacterized protein MIND_00390600 [Mycena indigotica]KAF7310170.1 hypothetical protein MIND_00390600 [Mycena indigotica]